jgi:hypothetical protein
MALLDPDDDADDHEALCAKGPAGFSDGSFFTPSASPS